jgi:hypothetical protein
MSVSSVRQGFREKYCPTAGRRGDFSRNPQGLTLTAEGTLITFANKFNHACGGGMIKQHGHFRLRLYRNETECRFLSRQENRMDGDIEGRTGYFHKSGIVHGCLIPLSAKEYRPE